MKITIYNANDNTEPNEFDSLLLDLKAELAKQHEVDYIDLKQLNLKYCTGCWSCWVKTPGRCQMKDDIDIVLRSFIQSDLVVFASPMKLGFPTSLMKKVNDRLIPLVHPYITLVDNECHHEKRYPKYPFWGLILEEEKAGDQEDIEIVKDIYRRTALNIKSSLLFTCTNRKTSKQIAHEINYL